MKVLLVNNGSSLQLRAAFNGNHSLSKANKWNETKRFTRCYVESDGSIVLEADYSFDVGFTIENLAKFLKIFRVSLQTFCSEVL